MADKVHCPSLFLAAAMAYVVAGDAKTVTATASFCNTLLLQPGLWSRSRWSRMFSAGVGVGFLKLLESESGFQKCWSRSRFFKIAGVGSRSRFFKTAGVGVGSWSRFFKTAGVGSRFFKTAGVGVRSRNPKKSSDSTTLATTACTTPP